MAALADDLLLEILKACARTLPEPLYPGAFASYSGLDRSLLDEALDHLRLRGLVRLTDWVQGRGQGYALTSQGEMVLQDPGLLGKAKVLETPPLRPVPQAEVPYAEGSAWAKGEAVRDSLVNPSRPVVSLTLIFVNLLLFAVGGFIATQRDVSLDDYLSFSLSDPQVNRVRTDMGGLNPALVLGAGEWWRLLTYAFVHAGFLHILMNMYFLFSVGPLLEKLWGSGSFLLLYCVGAVTGACVALFTLSGGVGASGALCGLLTSMGVWVFLNRLYLPPDIVASWQRNIFMNIIIMAIISTLPGVSWQGHLGGALGGAIVSLPLNLLRFGNFTQKILGLVGALAVPAVAIGWLMVEMKPKTEEARVEFGLFPTFQMAEATASLVFNEHAFPLLEKWNEKQAKSKLQEAQKSAAQAQELLQIALERFERAGSFQGKEASEAVKQGKVYLEAWSHFYQDFLKVLGQEPPWEANQYRSLEALVSRVNETRRPLQRSRLLRSPFHEVQK